MTTTRPTRHRRRSTALLGVILGATALVATACPEPPPSAGSGTTTTPGPTTTAAPTTTTPSSIKTLTNASFEWTVSKQTNNASQAPGQVNYWSAGISDGTAATYTATNGNATVLKKNAAGTYVPIGSETAVSFANKNRDGAGNVVTSSNAFFLGQKVRYTGGTGTVNTATGASTIQWTGTFTINFYGTYVPFWIKNPKLVVNGSGVGTLTASIAGFASSQDDPTIRIQLPERTVTLAEFTGLSAANTSGFTSTPAFLNVAAQLPSAQAAAAPQIAKTSANAGYWGAWPKSFVDFQIETGLGAYWYTSGSSSDVNKPVDPLTVAYNIAP